MVNGLKDPRVGFVTITEVRVTDDLRHAKMFVSVYGTDVQQRDSIEGLRSSAGYLKRELGKRLKLRYTPTISIFADESLEKSLRMDSVINAINAGELEAPPEQKIELAPVETVRSDVSDTADKLRHTTRKTGESRGDGRLRRKKRPGSTRKNSRKSKR